MGKFISLRCTGGGDVRRSYTILSPPGPGDTVEILVKDVAGGVGTAYFAGLAVGDTVHFTGPMGFFVPDAAHAGDAIHVATGAGVAASLPVIEATLARRDEATRVRLFWGLLDGQDTYLEDRLAAAARSPRFAWQLVRGAHWPAVHDALATHATLALAAAVEPPVVYYTVGNGDMCRRVRDALVAQGVDRRKQIRSETFYPVMEGQ